MSNFEKPLSEFSEEELIKRINQWSPQFAIMGQYELLRRLAIKNDRSSMRVGYAALGLALIQVILATITILK